MSSQTATWGAGELAFSAGDTTADDSKNYVEVDIWARFEADGHEPFERPLFYDGVIDGKPTWKLRVARPADESVAWQYTLHATPESHALDGRSGTWSASDATLTYAHGPLKMSAGGRSILRHDATPFFVVADTAWALPFRATLDEATRWADDRAAKGFNAVMLMSIQSDREVDGPEDRTAADGFARGFDDLPETSLKRLRVDYFQTLDELVGMLMSRGIVPIVQPVFGGYGWKGGSTAGRAISPDDMRRYCRYLIARYGAWPAIWLVSADAPNTQPNVDPAGQTFERWDCYAQPTGLHYGPQCVVAPHHDKPWLDFELAQTGHDGTDDVHRVTQLFDLEPIRATANGEPTYEQIGAPDRAVGWWQGDNAWDQLMAGGTMGVFYGAGSLWQWARDNDLADQQRWCRADVPWDRALSFEGSAFVGNVGKILRHIDTTDLVPRRELAGGRRCLAEAGERSRRFVVYQPGGLAAPVGGAAEALIGQWFDPKTAEPVGPRVSVEPLEPEAVFRQQIDPPEGWTEGEPLVFVAQAQWE